MGRPINKRYLGRTGSDPTTGIENEERLTAIVKVGANLFASDGIVLSQRSETRFRVNDNPDGSGNTGICLLVNKPEPAANEMVLYGYLVADADDRTDPINIRKMYNRTCTDFANNRYTWTIEDVTTQETVDADIVFTTQNVLVLTLI